MRVDLDKISNGICNKETKEYLDNLVDRLTEILQNIDEDNLTEFLTNTIKGDK